MKAKYTENEMAQEFCRLINLLPKNAIVKICYNAENVNDYSIKSMLKYTLTLAKFFNVPSNFIVQ